MTAPAECRLKESDAKDENEHHRYYDKDNKTICLKITLGDLPCTYNTLTHALYIHISATYYYSRFYTLLESLYFLSINISPQESSDSLHR